MSKFTNKSAITRVQYACASLVWINEINKRKMSLREYYFRLITTCLLKKCKSRFHKKQSQEELMGHIILPFSI